jgi:hypothetical protein
MKTLHILAGLALVVLLTACDRTEEPPVLLVYHEGKEYQILDRGDAMEDGQLTYFVRYYSKDIHDEAVLGAERRDLCTIIARHINTNVHQRVLITAVEHKDGSFRLFNPREITESWSAGEVLKYRPDGRKAEGR